MNNFCCVIMLSFLLGKLIWRVFLQFGFAKPTTTGSRCAQTWLTQAHPLASFDMLIVDRLLCHPYEQQRFFENHVSGFHPI